MYVPMRVTFLNNKKIKLNKKTLMSRCITLFYVGPSYWN